MKTEKQRRKRRFNGELELTHCTRERQSERERERERETRTIFLKDTQSLFNTLYMCVFNEHFYTSP